MNEIQQPITPNNHSRNRMLWLTAVVFIFIGIVWFLLWFFYLQFYESTDDAFANGNMVYVNPVISGSVTAFYADDTDLVLQGQLLATLDTTEYQIMYERELATLATITLDIRQLHNDIAAKAAVVESQEAAAEKLRVDYNNRQHLVESLAIAHQDFIHARDDLTIAEANLKQAKFNLQVSIDAAGNTDIPNHPRLEEQKAKVRQAYYNLHHGSIYAPCTGYIAQRSVNVGDYVSAKSNLMVIIPKNTVWVDANFKETQLTKMRIGQPATIWFDLYGSHIVFKGKVLGIASGSGSVFSLIPAQNATGNWIKIVQRLPVRISLDPEMVEKYPPRIGISANVEVDLSTQDLPLLAQTPSKKAIATTNVFTIPLEEVNQNIEEVIQNNL